MKPLRYILISLLVTQGLSMAAEYGGTAPLDFLHIGVGARAQAMGGIFVPAEDDLTASYWNPSGIGLIKRKGIVLSYNRWLEDINATFIGYVHPFSEGSCFGGSIFYLDYGQIQQTTLENRTGSGLKRIRPNDLVATLTCAGMYKKKMMLGVNLKFIREELANKGFSGIFLDVGFLMATERSLIGFVIQDLGGDVKFVSKEEKVPIRYKIEAIYRLMDGGLVLALNANRVIGERSKINGGIEYLISKEMIIRVGYLGLNNPEVGLTGGFGFRFKNFGFDYAYVPFGDLKSTHRASFFYQF
ncbi:MAG: PorV/PorQ family protein [bacterium]|nr:PorV/PorQ family protein [bacterium]